MTRRAPAAAVQSAIAALARGETVIVVDDADRENEGDLVIAAQFATAEAMSFMVRHTTGIVCVPMSAARADALQLPAMVANNTDAHATAFTVSVDHISTGTGVSAHDRARTALALADSATRPEDLRRPGHIFPLRARDGGVLVRPGHTEASVDLMRLAGLTEVAVISEIVADDGSMRVGSDLRDFARQHHLEIVNIADLVGYRRATEQLVQHVASATMPTEFGEFRAVAYRSTVDGIEHLALVMGDVAEGGRSQAGVLVRVHSECLTGDTFSSQRCDCGDQLRRAMQAVADEGCGVIVYLRGHEGRGIGLAHKIRAYSLQERGYDTVDANVMQGLPVDSRTYGTGAHILSDLGVRQIRLITNNPAKYGGLSSYGLKIVGRVSLPSLATAHNIRYLTTKQERMGHEIDVDPAIRIAR
jgi:3,4-dihydroxy 2-butanone 4-phosphate synthase/GTP cyclohydrolase II